MHIRSTTSLAAVLIVRNESRVIERCLKSIKGVDEIIVLDTGSTDSTPDICIKNGAKVYYDVWRDNFAEARNKANSYCTSDWIFIIDADEYVSEGSIKLIRLHIEKNKGDVFTCITRTGEKRALQARVFRNNPEKIFWKGAAHNYINRKADGHIEIEIISTNEGWSFNNDPDRGVRILNKHLDSYPNAQRERYYLGREYMAKCRYEEALFHFGEIMDSYPDPDTRGDIHLNMAKAYIHLKRMRRAINHLHESIKIDPKIPECYRLLHRLTKEGIYSDIAKIAKGKQLIQDV